MRSWSVFILCFGFGVCCVSFLFQTVRLIRTRPRVSDKGDRRRIRKAVSYSFFRAMSPFKKESAYRHWISYLLGIVFHTGSFLAFFWLLIRLVSLPLPRFAASISQGYLWLTGACGMILLAKRIFSPSVRRFSNFDDVFSNLLVTGFHGLSAVTINRPDWLPWLQVYSGILFIFIPFTKLRHVLYFVSARIHLAIYYGIRGLWPPKSESILSKKQS